MRAYLARKWAEETAFVTDDVWLKAIASARKRSDFQVLHRD
jgi:hypothetical protein